MDSLASLAAAAAGGSTPATSDLLERVWPDAYRIAWSVLGERTAAEDAAQEACARLWASIGTLRRPDAFVGWFYRIVVNEAKRRRRTLRRTASLDATAATDVGAPPEDRIDLVRALQALDPSLRVATVLRYYYDLNGNEIARIVGASPVTVRWRLFMARRRLRTMLGLSASSSPGLATNRIGAYADEPQSIR